MVFSHNVKEGQQSTGRDPLFSRVHTRVLLTFHRGELVFHPCAVPGGLETVLSPDAHKVRERSALVDRCLSWPGTVVIYPSFTYVTIYLLKTNKNIIINTYSQTIPHVFLWLFNKNSKFFNNWRMGHDLKLRPYDFSWHKQTFFQKEKEFPSRRDRVHCVWWPVPDVSLRGINLP